MTTEDFIRELFYRVDEAMKDVPKHPQASLWPSEVVPLGVLFALKGVGNRAVSRGLKRDWRELLPALPERTRLFRLLASQRSWPDAVLATPAVLGGVASYGGEVLHPLRQGRSAQHIGRKGKSTHRWSGWGKTGSAAHPLGSGRGLGLCRSPCAGPRLSIPCLQPLRTTGVS
jgi:hypothetical protein